jgi:uncharacterized membrane protein
VRRRETASLTAAAALALSFAPTLMRRRAREQLAVSVASAALGGLAGAASEVLVIRLAERLEGGEGAARAVLAGAGALSVLAELPSDPHPAVSLAGQAARVSGICALIGAVAPARDAVPLDRPRTLVAVGLAGVAALAGWQQLEKRSRPRRPRLAEYPAERRLATTSCVAGGFEGSRFTGTAVAADEIEAAASDRGVSDRGVSDRGVSDRGVSDRGVSDRGAPYPSAIDPIRVFVGVRAAESVEERARIAVDQLERLGAFERGRILVCSATLRGYVNPIPIAAEEHFSRGNVASVVVQYHDRRTLLMPAKVPIAARTHRALLEELRRRLPREGGPEVCVYGESLGAWASQNVFRGGGVQALDEAGVSRALWIGTPYFSRLPRLLAKGELPTDDRIGTIRTKELLAGAGDPAWRFVFLERRTDPVVLFSGLELIWRRPDWLPPGRWTPGVTFVQLAFDLVAATNWTSSVPQALAHDYRLEGPLAVDLALGHNAGRERAAELADRLVAEEVARGARLRALRRGGVYTPGH